jgi:GT2 family glycosyltransferase
VLTEGKLRVQKPVATGVVALVLNWNGFEDTVECIESILRSDLAPGHVVVLDNGSIDGSTQRLEAWAAAQTLDYVSFASPAEARASDPPSEQLVFIECGRNLGYAGGNNIGIRYAIELTGAEFIWILNNDVVVDHRALRRAVDLAQSDPDIGIVGAKLLRYDEPETIQALGGGYIVPVFCHDTQLGSGRHSETAGDKPIRVDHLIGASLLVRVAAVRDVGLIDESYFLYREETDWCIRMVRRGWKLFCSPNSLVWHKQARSIGFKSPLHDYYAVRNVLHLVRKFYPASLPTAFAYFACRSIAPKLARFELARLHAVCLALRDFAMGVKGQPAAYGEAALVREYVDKLDQQDSLDDRPAFILNGGAQAGSQRTAS